MGRFDPDEVTFFLTIAAPLAAIIDEAATVGEVARLLSGEVRRTAFIQGVQAAAGLAVGTAALLDPLATLESVPDRRVEDVASEENEFRAAVAAVQSEMRARGERLAEAVPREVREIFDVYVMLLGSGELVQETVERIRAGNWAPGAWRDRARRSLELSRASGEEEEAAEAVASRLRPRELAILRLYGEGLATHQIAELLVLSVHTVRTHVKNALRRLGVSSRSEAIDLLKHADGDPAI